MDENKIKDKRIKTKDIKNIYFRSPSFLLLVYELYARMAELVDALVSNTSGSNAVPVRSRLRVLKKSESESESESVSNHPHSFSLKRKS